MIDIQKIYKDSFDEWIANTQKGDQPIVLSSGDTIPRNCLAHVELLLANYHKALREELAKQGIYI